MTQFSFLERVSTPRENFPMENFISICNVISINRNNNFFLAIIIFILRPKKQLKSSLNSSSILISIAFLCAVKNRVRHKIRSRDYFYPLDLMSWTWHYSMPRSHWAKNSDGRTLVVVLPATNSAENPRAKPQQKFHSRGASDNRKSRTRERFSAECGCD